MKPGLRTCCCGVHFHCKKSLKDLSGVVSMFKVFSQSACASEVIIASHQTEKRLTCTEICGESLWPRFQFSKKLPRLLLFGAQLHARREVSSPSNACSSTKTSSFARIALLYCRSASHQMQEPAEPKDNVLCREATGETKRVLPTAEGKAGEFSQGNVIQI